MVVYDRLSTDGWCGAWILDRCFNGVQLVPFDLSMNTPVIDGRTVLFVSIGFSRDQVEDINQYAHRAIIFDHHNPAKNFRGLDCCVIDTSRSSSVLALDWCNYNGYLDNYTGVGNNNNRDVATGMVSIAKYVQDKELGNYRLPNSKLINLCIDSYSCDLKQWDMLARKASVNPEAMTVDGIAIDRYLSKMGIRHDSPEQG